MTREEFVEGYMTRSGLLPYTLDGEKVTYGDWTQWALECHCGEDGCDGWAMVHDGGQGWHKFRNGVNDEASDDSFLDTGPAVATRIIP